LYFQQWGYREALEVCEKFIPPINSNKRFKVWRQDLGDKMANQNDASKKDII